MNCLMFYSEERGVLISGGKPWTDEEVAAAVRGEYMTNLRDIAELLDKGVAYRDSRGAIFCKRMVRDEAERQKTKKRVQKHRSNGDVTPSVTPLKRPCTVTETVTEIIPTRFKLEDFDGHDEFESLCQVYPKAERSIAAQTRYFEAVEWCVDNKHISRKEAASYVKQRAELYASICKFQKGLTKWLEDKTFEQPESAWSDKPQPISHLDKLYGN